MVVVVVIVVFVVVVVVEDARAYDKCESIYNLCTLRPTLIVVVAGDCVDEHVDECMSVSKSSSFS
jgi:hypothetical protein